MAIIRARSVRAVLAWVVCTAAVAVQPVRAATPAPAAFVLLQGSHAWSATGAVVDAGAWRTDRAVLGGIPSPVAFAGTLFTTLTSDLGTIELRLFVTFDGVEEHDLCTVTGGSGAYDRIAGQGTWSQLGRGTDAVLTCVAAVERQ